jgi:hypothetical protein
MDFDMHLLTTERMETEMTEDYDFLVYLTKHKVKLEYGSADVEVSAFAKDYDLEIVVPGKNEILIDIDQPKIPDSFFEQLEIMQQFYSFESYTYWRSRGGNTHVILRLSENQPVLPIDLTPEKRILFALLFGSDPKRAALGLKDLFTGRFRPEYLFRPNIADTFTEILDSLSRS